MNLAQIKNLICTPDEELHELDVVLSIEHLLTKHRSVFLDQRVYDLSKPMYKILRRFMEKAADVSERNGDLFSYFVIPVVVHSLPSDSFAPITDNIDSCAISSVLEHAGFISDDFELSPIVMPRRSLFGANIFGVFDHPRTLFGEEESYFSKEQLISESENQYVFYITGYQKGTLGKIEKEEWHERMLLLESRISRCSGSKVAIETPVSLSVEVYRSIFRDAWVRLSNALDYSDICLIDNVCLNINDIDINGSELVLCHGTEIIASIEVGKVSDLNSDILMNELNNFAAENELGHGKLAFQSKAKEDNKLKPKKPKSFLTLVK